MTTHTSKPLPSWLSDSLEGHMGNALQVQMALESGMYQPHDWCPGCSRLRHKAEARLAQMLSDLADRLDGMGLRVVESARVRAVRTVAGVSLEERD